MLLELTEENFTQSVARGVTLVDFYGTNCGPCQILAKLMPHLANKYEGQVTVAKVNTGVSFTLAQQFGIFSVPTVVILQDGKEVERLKGLQPPEAYVERLQYWIDNQGRE